MLITGLWFWWGCAGCGTSAPNLLNLRDLFRHVNPALTKSNPNVFARYMRGAVKVPNVFSCSLPKYKTFRLPTTDFRRVNMRIGFLLRGFGGLRSSSRVCCQLFFAVFGLPISAPWVSRPVKSRTC